MKDDIDHAFVPISPETTAKLQQCVSEIWQEISARLLSAYRAVRQETPTAPGVPIDLEPPPKGRPPVATFSELLFEKSERPAHVMPPGLRIGLLAASQLQDVPPTEVTELVADIRRNLDWADAELRSVSVTLYTIKHWLQLEMAREQVTIFERFGPAESNRAAPGIPESDASQLR